LLVRQLGKMSAREALSQLGLRKRPSRVEYVRSCFVGMWQSLRFPVDRQSRLYRAPARG
jgi:hypothetical protein